MKNETTPKTGINILITQFFMYHLVFLHQYRKVSKTQHNFRVTPFQKEEKQSKTLEIPKFNVKIVRKWYVLKHG